MLKTLAKSIRQYKKTSVLSPVCVTFEVALECILPFYMTEMLDRIQLDNSLSNIIKWGAILLVFAALSLLFGMLAGKFSATASAGFARNLREDMYYRIQDFSFANIDKFSTSSLVTRMTTDVTNVQNAYMMLIRVAVRSPIMLVFSLVMAFFIDPTVSLMFLVLIPVLGIGLFIIFKKSWPIFDKVFKKYDAMNESIQENIKGIRVVKSYVREDYEKNKFAATAENVKKDFVCGEKLIALSNPLMQFCFWAATLFICFMGPMVGITKGDVGVSSKLSSLIVYTAQILSSLMMLSMVLLMFSITPASAERIV